MTIKNKKNVLLVGSSLDVGGAETVIANLCRYLDRQLFDVTVCHLKERGKIGKELADEGYDVIGVDRADHSKPDYLSFLKLRNIVKMKQTDILHTHTLYSLMDASLCKLTYPGLRTVHTFHFGNYPHVVKKHLFLERVFWRIPERLVAVGHEQKKSIRNTHGIPESRIVTIWNGVDHKQNLDKAIIKEYVDHNKIIIGSVSTLIEQKGLQYLLEVAYKLKKKRNDFVFLIAGDGHLRNELESKSRSLGLENTVYFIGRVENAGSRLLPLFDILVQTSLWEAMSIVLLEAMACGKPVVATSVGDNNLVIEEGKTGFLVEPKDIEEIAAALERLLDQQELREDIGRNAIQKYHNEFSAEMMARRYENLYMEVLNH